MEISVILAAYKEEANLIILLPLIIEYLGALNLEYEIQLIGDFTH